jgi:hypothetical protein
VLGLDLSGQPGSAKGHRFKTFVVLKHQIAREAVATEVAVHCALTFHDIDQILDGAKV